MKTILEIIAMAMMIGGGILIGIGIGNDTKYNYSKDMLEEAITTCYADGNSHCNTATIRDGLVVVDYYITTEEK